MRVVVTGMGIVSPIGRQLEEVKEALRVGKCGIREITAFAHTDSQVKFAGEVDIDLLKHFDKKEIKRMDRVNALGMIAARDAFEDSKLSREAVKDASIILSSGIGGLKTIEEEAEKANAKGYHRISPFFIPKAIANMTGADVAIDLGIHGYSSTPVTACAGSLTAILDAYRHIKDGYSDICFAGGSEASINRLGIHGFESMKALSTVADVDRASIPFDKERSGFVMGEGAAVLVLESFEHAMKRGANIYGEIVGASASTDAFHMTAPLDSGEYAKKAMVKAIEESGLEADAIDYICAHGTSTYLNDLIEGKIYSELFKNPCVSSTKAMTGHLLGASGALETAFSLLAISGGFYPGTLHYKVKDEAIDLNITPKSVEKNIQVVMKNALGFGGHNVSIILRKVN